MPQLLAGYARADITPPVGSTMAGYGARDRPCDSVETPLEVCALVVTDGTNHAAIAFADLIGVPLELSRAIRGRVADVTGIPADAVAIACSHTHWGPDVQRSEYMPKHLHECVLPEYVDCLERTIAGCIAEAWAQRAPARAGWGTGWADSISFNRRPVRTDGQVAMNLVMEPGMAAAASSEGAAMRAQWKHGGDGGPRLTPPLDALGGLRAGVTDPQIPLLKVLAETGAPLCGVISFACHPVVGGDDNMYAISPDYPGQAREAFAAVTGTPLAFSLGSAGNQVPSWRTGDSRTRVGRSLGAEAARTWHHIRDCSADVTVAAARSDVRIPLRELPPIQQARAELAECDDPESPDACYQRHLVSLAEKFEGKPGIETEIWACRIGDFGMIGLPGEIFVELGLQIIQRSAFPVTAVMTLTNDCVGYISTAKAHAEGGYEPTWSAPGPAAETALVDAAVELLNSLR